MSGNAKYTTAVAIAMTSTIATIEITNAFGFALYAFFAAFSTGDEVCFLDFVDFEDFFAILPLYKRSRKMAIVKCSLGQKLRLRERLYLLIYQSLLIVFQYFRFTRQSFEYIISIQYIIIYNYPYTDRGRLWQKKRINS